MTATMKGPANFLAQFVGNTPPRDTLPEFAGAGLDLARLKQLMGIAG